MDVYVKFKKTKKFKKFKVKNFQIYFEKTNDKVAKRELVIDEKKSGNTATAYLLNSHESLQNFLKRNGSFFT